MIQTIANCLTAHKTITCFVLDLIYVLLNGEFFIWQKLLQSFTIYLFDRLSYWRNSDENRTFYQTDLLPIS